MSAGPSNQVTEQDSPRLKMPKLVAYGDWDFTQVAMEMTRMHCACALLKERLVLDSSAHGSDLLDMPQGDELRQRLLAFPGEITASRHRWQALTLPSVAVSIGD
jgi:hypothetical protein